MKTVFINCSPKKRLSASSWFLAIQRLFVGGKPVLVKLRTPADHAKIMEQLTDADAVVFAMPLYVDGIPSHVLTFLEKLEQMSRETDLHFRVYGIANNGFIEGRQNEPLMRSLEHFCARSGLTWCGGVGIGGGVMLNVTRILFVVDIAISRHFRKRLYTVCHGPYRSGSSRHGAPPLAIHSIPFSAVRLSYFAGRPRFPPAGCSGGSISLTRFHSLSVSSYRFVPTQTVYIIVSGCATFIFQTRPSTLRTLHPRLQAGRGCP